jgi:hypothetical protein
MSWLSKVSVSNEVKLLNGLFKCRYVSANIQDLMKEI